MTIRQARPSFAPGFASAKSSPRSIGGCAVAFALPPKLISRLRVCPTLGRGHCLLRPKRHAGDALNGSTRTVASKSCDTADAAPLSQDVTQPDVAGGGPAGTNGWARER